MGNFSAPPPCAARGMVEGCFEIHGGNAAAAGYTTNG